MDLEGSNGFNFLQEIFGSHPCKLAETPVRESQLCCMVDSNTPPISQLDSTPAEYFKLTDDGREESSKAIYLNMIIQEMSRGQPVGPLFWCFVWLEYLSVFPWSEDKTRCGRFLVADLFAKIRCGLRTNSKNTVLNVTLQTPDRGTLDFFTEEFDLLYKSVSDFILQSLYPKPYVRKERK